MKDLIACSMNYELSKSKEVFKRGCNWASARIFGDKIICTGTEFSPKELREIADLCAPDCVKEDKPFEKPNAPLGIPASEMRKISIENSDIMKYLKSTALSGNRDFHYGLLDHSQIEDLESLGYQLEAQHTPEKVIHGYKISW